MSDRKQLVETRTRTPEQDLLRARQQALSGLVATPHRMESVAVLNEVQYVNDSRATFLDATLESFAAFEERVVWISGAWSDDMAEGHMQELLKERISAVVLFGAAHDVAENGDAVQVFAADNVRMAVFLARELAKPGEVVLFSPACPSGNGFANYEERGAEFKRAVKDL